MRGVTSPIAVNLFHKPITSFEPLSTAIIVLSHYQSSLGSESHCICATT